MATRPRLCAWAGRVSTGGAQLWPMRAAAWDMSALVIKPSGVAGAMSLRAGARREVQAMEIAVIEEPDTEQPHRPIKADEPAEPARSQALVRSAARFTGLATEVLQCGSVSLVVSRSSNGTFDP